MAPTNSSLGSAMLCVGRRVRVRDRRQICGEIVRVMPMTGRVIVARPSELPPEPKPSARIV